MPIPSNVGDDEQVARYFFSNKVSWRDFLPKLNTDLSVTRHYGLSQSEIVDIGLSVAIARQKTLHGRADFCVVRCREFGGDVVANPIESNENHADVTGWTESKDERMAFAVHLHAISTVHKLPDPE